MYEARRRKGMMAVKQQYLYHYLTQSIYNFVEGPAMHAHTLKGIQMAVALKLAVTGRVVLVVLIYAPDMFVDTVATEPLRQVETDFLKSENF